MKRALSLRSVAAGVVLAAAGAALVSAQSDPSSTEWRRMRSSHFTAAGNATESDIRAILAEVESFHGAMEARFHPLDDDGATKPILVVFKDDRALTPFKPRDERGRVGEGTAGFFVTHPDVTYIVVSARGADRDNMLRVVLHEYVHDILQKSSASDLPLWLKEGLAEYYASAVRNGEGVSVGRPLPDRQRTLSSGRRLSLEELVTARSYIDVRDSGREIMFYAQAWAMTHYLVAGHGGTRDGQLDAFVSALQQGFSTEEAFTSAFQTSIEKMEDELEAYIDRNRYQAVALSVASAADPAAPGSVEPMLSSEVAALEGDILLRVGNYDEADRRLTPSVKSWPSSVPLRMSLGILRMAQNRPAEAVTALRSVVAERPDLAAGRWHLARALGRSGANDEAVEEFRRALELDPRLSPALASSVSGAVHR